MPTDTTLPLGDPMTLAACAFDGEDVLAASGVKVNIPTGVHWVERRSLVYRVRLGGREIDITLGEFERLVQSGRVKPSSETPAAD